MYTLKQILNGEGLKLRGITKIGQSMSEPEKYFSADKHDYFGSDIEVVGYAQGGKITWIDGRKSYEQWCS